MVLESRIVPGAPKVVDGVDRLLADLLGAHLAQLPAHPTIAVVNARGPGLLGLLGEVAPGATVLAHNDLLDQEHAVDQDPALPLERVQPALTEDSAYSRELFSRADIVLVRLPKSLGALTDLARAAAQSLRSDTMVIGAQKDKYLTHSATEVLESAFATVTASLGKYKSRALVARTPLPGVPAPQPTITTLPELGLTMSSLGGVFSAAKLDIGTRFLLGALPDLMADYAEATEFVDLGCGTGLLSAWVARNRPTAQVVATDLSLAAVRSTRATAALNNLSGQITVKQADALAGLAPHSADVIVCNPPFHTGTVLETATARRMFEQAGRVLRPNAEMWTVFNTPLRYGPLLTAAVGPTEVIAQNSKFQVTRSTTAARPR